MNTTAHGVHHRVGGNFRDERKKKTTDKAEAQHEGMHGRKNRGLDYTPLFRFLLSKVGQEWNSIHSEAIARLDRAEPIFWLVALRQADEKKYVRTGESSYFSGLRVDSNGTLQVVNPKIDAGSLAPLCKCCTHTFNGVRFTRSFDPDAVPGSSAYRVAKPFNREDVTRQAGRRLSSQTLGVSQESHMRNVVAKLVALGRLPEERDAEASKLQAFESALRDIERPVSKEEASALLSVFPLSESSCFGLAWSLLHLVESAPGWPFREGKLQAAKSLGRIHAAACCPSMKSYKSCAAPPNPSIERTRIGRPRYASSIFFAPRGLPLRASHVKR